MTNVLLYIVIAAFGFPFLFQFLKRKFPRISGAVSIILSLAFEAGLAVLCMKLANEPLTIPNIVLTFVILHVLAQVVYLSWVTKTLPGRGSL